MSNKVFNTILSLFLFVPMIFIGQNVTLFNQFNGRVDFTFIGNTMNTAENNSIFAPVTLTSSSAQLNLNPNDEVLKAYLYWAGSGDGDFEVNLNGQIITPERTFSYFRIFDGVVFTYFSAFKDVTNQITATGNGLYTLSDLDISPFENLHLSRRTNFAGWAIAIIYRNDNLPLNQINVYDGLQGVPDNLSINLSNLNVLDNANSKIGFLAWEGDALLATETFQLNGMTLSNALNPPNNVFNSTNSFTGSSTLYNMDLDVYDTSSIIQIGDTSAQITLSSYQDFIMVNTVITKLNNQLPDATVVINSIETVCDSRVISVNLNVNNFNATGDLPAQTLVAVYINNTFLQMFPISVTIPPDGTWNYTYSITIPENFGNNFILTLVVDDDGTGTSHVAELDESNNKTLYEVTLFVAPTFNNLASITVCNEGFGKGTFDFSNYDELVKTNPTDYVSFFETEQNAQENSNPIITTSQFVATSTPKTIYVRISNENCFSITSFDLLTRNCPPTVYNFISANQDGVNDVFSIAGLYDIFLNFKIEIYSRWGRLLWTGNQNKPKWDGYVKDGIGSKKAPDGTYFYILYLNDPEYPTPINGYLYLVN